ncbi:aldo/keto reductase [Comamonas endophytica]|uniref:Aldo/keto reductase n=1 Tax=Comamonas endophytica TaxID=2949090 RepID=A0ABY6G9D3_9BURK|nr:MULTISPECIES: aldo/keto reductase [unclassified Acidovorax]MCD2511805.1 aldo/keto reductase [Acidovorax sp. D4N7]UYG51528.1 aldo/keto reductase [Acidovorax sp. 5MLIR]
MTASPLRPLGRSGLQVSPLCLGGNVFGWTVDEADAFSLLDAWLDAGFNFIDTADVYSRWVPGHAGGESERILGRWLSRSGRRARVVLATKVGKDMGEGRRGLRPEYIRTAVEASLRRLQTDHIDLYQSHEDDAQVPLADTLGAYADLMAAGKVRAIGASNYSAVRFKEALVTSERLGLPRYESLQPLYNLYDRAAFERELAPLCQSQQIGVINFHALAAGFLTGKYRSPGDAGKSPRGANTVKTYLNPRGLAVLQALDAVAERLGAQPGQVALAWQLQRPAVTSPIASASSLAQLGQLVQAAQLQLSAQDMEQLTAASSEDGARD